jgi:hypothetical protein
MEPKIVAINIPGEVLEVIDREVIRRRAKRIERKELPPEEMVEAMKIANQDGTAAANAYLAERTKFHYGQKGGTSRCGIVLELVLLGVKNLPQIGMHKRPRKKIEVEEHPQ